MRIVFMGTPEFAVASLAALYESNHEVVAVVTAPDKPTGRGLQVSVSAVKKFALAHDLPVLQPEKLRNPEFIQALASYRADVFVVVAFRMLPEVVWSMPPKGTLNLHASLLPNYRGAAPINWAIINGEKETGLTTFLITHEIDTGAILFQEKESIHDDDTVGTLYERLMKKGSALVVKTVTEIAENRIHPIEQTESTNLQKAPKIFRESCEINWNQPALAIRNFVRGLSPYPGAWFTFHGKIMKVFRVKILDENDPGVSVGDMISDRKSFIKIQTSDRAIALLDIQLEGKKQMGIDEFLRGYNWPS